MAAGGTGAPGAGAAMRAVVFAAACVAASSSVAVAPATPPPPPYDPTERAALVELWEATGGASGGWEPACNWGNPGSPCEWCGVTCDPQDGGHVTKLDLMDQEMAGPMGAVKGLTHLKLLYMGTEDNLTGTLDTLAGLTNLTDIALGCNPLTGTLDPLEGLTKLTHLQIGSDGCYEHGRLTGTIDVVKKLTLLTCIDLSFNKGLGGLCPPLPFEQYNSCVAPFGPTCNLRGINFTCPLPDGAAKLCGATCGPSCNAACDTHADCAPVSRPDTDMCSSCRELEAGGKTCQPPR